MVTYHRAFLWSVDTSWPLSDCWPQQFTTLWSEVLPTNFGNHRAFQRRVDLWITFDHWWGHFKNMLTNLSRPLPTCQLWPLYVETHYRTYIHSYINTDCFYIISIVFIYSLFWLRMDYEHQKIFNMLRAPDSCVTSRYFFEVYRPAWSGSWLKASQLDAFAYRP